MELCGLEEETNKQQRSSREHRERDDDPVPNPIATEPGAHRVPRRVGVDGNLTAGLPYRRLGQEPAVEPTCRGVEGYDVAPVSSESAESVFDAVNRDRRLLAPARAFRHESAVVRAEDGFESGHTLRRRMHPARLGPDAPKVSSWPDIAWRPHDDPSCLPACSESRRRVIRIRVSGTTRGGRDLHRDRRRARLVAQREGRRAGRGSSTGRPACTARLGKVRAEDPATGLLVKSCVMVQGW